MIKFEEKGSKNIPPRKFLGLDKGKSHLAKIIWIKKNEKPVVIL